MSAYLTSAHLDPHLLVVGCLVILLLSIVVMVTWAFARKKAALGLTVTAGTLGAATLLGAAFTAVVFTMILPV